jgi:carbamoyltransferase
MRFCGIKFGHDGAVALIENDTLEFSVEIEKIDNNIRHAPLFDLAIVMSILEQHGYAVEDIDYFVLDGWHPRRDIFKWGDKEVHLPRARYIQTPLHRGLLDYPPVRHPAFPYLSYPHYAGHAIGGYCSSPFAERGESAYLLSWDGGMVPYLYYFDAGRSRIENLGSPFNLVGDLYAEVAMGVGPFSANPSQWETLGTPGKIMAYVAYGNEREALIGELANAYEDLPALHDGNVRDIYSANIDFIRKVRRAPWCTSVNGEDMITSYHAFVQRLLLDSLDQMAGGSRVRARNLCYAGGCALNIKWNQAIRRSGLFEEVWIPPFPNDAGSAIGTACCAMLGSGTSRTLRWSAYAGPGFIVDTPAPGWSARECSIAELAALLHRSNAPVLLLDGNAEIGPRALGNRSILAPATRAGMKDTLNRIKQRENYRPVAPVCLERFAPEIFDPGQPDPYMLFDHRVRDEWKARIPAVQHLDGTARLQTVNARQNPRLFDLLTEYHRLSGIPLLCNTSANFRHKGFFPNLSSATRWGEVDLIWSAGRLYTAPGAG